MCDYHSYSSEEIGKLKELRSRVSSVLAQDYQRENSFLIGWLRARQLNVDKAEEMLRKSLAWRKTNRVDEIVNLDEIPEKYKRQTPFAYLGVDKVTGCPVFLYLMGRHDNRTVLEEVGIEKAIRYNICGVETMRRMLMDISKELGRPVTQVIEIIDLEGYSYRQISSKLSRDTMLAVQSLMDANYPEMIHHISMINAPKVFYTLYTLMKPFIPKETMEKIDIYGTDSEKWKAALASKYPMNLVPKRWGGTLEGSDDFCSQNDIWFFGPLHPTFFANANNEDYVKAKIKARDKLCIDFQVEASPDPEILTWTFKLENYDIGFGVLIEDREIIPVRRIEGIQEGQLECKQPGRYSVVFDNTYSYTRGKTVYHSISKTI